MTTFQQAQAEGLCLRFPNNLGNHREINYEHAVEMLLRAVPTSQNTPFVWGFIDKPADGQILLLFLSTQAPFPNDGIRYQDAEVKYAMPVGTTRELEVHEAKCGFIPGSQDQNASRVRRRYRLVKGGHSQLVLVHYTRGQPAPIAPALVNQPVRAYPLRTINEPPMFVIGDKAGQKVYPPGGSSMHGPPSAPPMPPTAIGMGMNMSQQQAMLAHQNSNMEMLERRREREREQQNRNRSGSTGRPPRPEDDDSGDDTEQIATRTLAFTRYKRNHDLMNDVFRQAAYGDKKERPYTSPYSIFNKDDLETKAAKLEAEIETLKQKSASRKLQGAPDISMESFGDPISA